MLERRRFCDRTFDKMTVRLKREKKCSTNYKTSITLNPNESEPKIKGAPLYNDENIFSTNCLSVVF